MKRTPTYLLLLSFIITGTIVLSNSHSAQAVTTSKWYTKASDFKKVEQAAKKKDKPYILFFYTDWCGYCKKMNKKYLSNNKIKQLLSKYHKIKINPDKGEEEHALANQKGVGGYPDFRIVHPDGKSIKLHPFQQGGSLKVKAFIKYLNAALNGDE